jgi:hypothetical protein
MLTPHCNGQSTVLASGKVLFTGGYDPSSGAIVGSELYDPTANSFTAVGPMIQQRTQHTATLLLSGRVLLVGGSSTQGALSGTEYFDPTANSFTAGPQLSVPRYSHMATLLPSGSVAVAGGESLETSSGFYGPNSTLELISLSQSVSGAGILNGRSQGTETALGDGSILIVGQYPTADWVTIGTPVLTNPAPSITAQPYGLEVPYIFYGYDVAQGAQLLVDGNPESQTIVNSSEEIEDYGVSRPTSGTHTVQIRNPDGKLSNIVQGTF